MVEVVTPVPSRGEIFLDARGGSSALRLSWHDDQGLVVLSLWREDCCAGTFRLPVGAVPQLVEALVSGLAASPAGIELPPARVGAAG